MPLPAPQLGAVDSHMKATSSTDQYATRHNPFVYFRHHLITGLREKRGQPRRAPARPRIGKHHAQPVLHHPEPVP